MRGRGGEKGGSYEMEGVSELEVEGVSDREEEKDVE